VGTVYVNYESTGGVQDSLKISRNKTFFSASGTLWDPYLVGPCGVGTAVGDDIC